MRGHVSVPVAEDDTAKCSTDTKLSAGSVCKVVLAVLFCLGLSVLFATLGFWQLSRATWKAEQVQQALARRDLPAIKLDSQQKLADMKLWRTVSFLAEKAPGAPLVYLDNQVRSRQTGYLVYQPLELYGTGHAVLWQHSWLPAGPDRAVLPQLAGADIAVPGQAVLVAPPAAGIDLGAPVEHIGEALRVQKIDFDMLSALLGMKLVPYILSTDSNIRGPQYPVSPQRHKGYAFQWFALSLLVPVMLAFYATSKYRLRQS